MNPLMLVLIGVLFLGIGFFSIVLARRRFQQARALGQPAVWYKDLGLLTGFEYTLLGIIIFLNLIGSQIPNQTPLKATIDIVFAGILFLAIILLFAVVFTMLTRPRRQRQALQAAASVVEVNTQLQSPEERAAETQRKRERRQKAAAARRRRSGRA